MLSDTDAGAGSLSLNTPANNQDARLPRASQRENGSTSLKEKTCAETEVKIAALT